MNFYLIVAGAISLFLSCAFMGLFTVMTVMNKSVVVILELGLSENFISELSCPLVLDLVSCSFLMAVLYISGSVIVFTGFYMEHEKFLLRFILLVFLFVFSMAFLIMFPNFLFMMIGWDGLGVVSFLLVIYYSNSDSLSAGMITAISNRVGDVFFIFVLGLMSCLLSFGFSSLYLSTLPFIGILILLGSITKSAQIPFSAWLPEAMAAPTPVSTLVHSSTLVTAGVYVLIRFNELMNETNYYLLTLLSMVTVIVSGSSGIVEVDMKKVVALSTLSQVGMMMFAISVGAISMAFFHLLVHAFFKALMFLCVGGVIFYSGGVQDARCLSGLWMKMPLTCSLLLFSNMSLMGFPFMSGFYSKEMILGSYLVGECSMIGFSFLFLSLVLTSCYAVRMMTLMMSSTESSLLNCYMEENKYYLTSLILMGNGAVFVGLLIQSLSKSMVFFVFMNSSYFYGWVLVWVVWILNLIFMLNLLNNTFSFKKSCYFMLSKMWFLKEMSGNLISSKSLIFFSKMVTFIEMGWIRGEIWGKGIKNIFSKQSNAIQKISFNTLGLVMMFSLFFWVILLL